MGCRVGISTYFFMMVGYPGEEMEDLRQSVKMLVETQPDVFSITIAYPLPGTEFYQPVRNRILYDGDDWAFTAENKLLFERGKYNTLFYRWVQLWFHKEWEVARANSGRDHLSLYRQLRNLTGLFVCRTMVQLLARLPGGGTVAFKPVLGR